MKINEMISYEHHIIEKLFTKLKSQIELMKKTNEVQGNFIDVFTDFFMTYIDVYHHGKEENILFKKLSNKKLSISDKNSIDLLVEQHELGRKLVEKIITDVSNYFKGNTTIIHELIELLGEFLRVYSEHVIYEEKFFPKLSKYFTEVEKEELINEFFKFNIKMVDEKYKNILELL